MDIAFVNRMLGLERGGGEIWDLRMAEELEKNGHSVTFYVGKPLSGDLQRPIREFDSVSVRTIDLRNLGYAAPKGVGGFLHDVDSQAFSRRVASVLQEEHDLVQVCSDPRFARVADRIDAFLSLVMHGTPYSLWHDVVHPRSSSYRFFNQFDEVIAVGGAYERIQSRVSREIHRVDPGVDTDQFTPVEAPDVGSDGVSILFVGRFVPAKQLSLLVDAFEELHSSYPEVQLTLVGDGPLREDFQDRVAAEGLSGSVSFPGYVPNDEIVDYYRNADVFVLSSRTEAYPMTLLEAMSCGVPTVGPNVGGIPEIIDDGVNGFVYPEGELEALTNRLESLLDSTSTRRQFGVAARSKAVESFDWENQGERLTKIYEERGNSRSN